jgi:hypothetical protein
VIDNLVGNAPKYAPAGGTVRVAVRPEGDQAVLEVADTGIGIAPEALPRVFDVFAQGRRSLDRSKGGSKVAGAPGLTRRHRPVRGALPAARRWGPIVLHGLHAGVDPPDRESTALDRLLASGLARDARQHVATTGAAAGRSCRTRSGASVLP